MIKLSINDTQLVSSIFNEIDGASWFVEQVKQGHGVIFIKDEQAKTALMIADSSEYFYVGQYDETFLKASIDWIRQHVVPKLDDPIGFFYYGSSLWHDGLIQLLDEPIDPEHGRYLIRRYHRLNSKQFDICKQNSKPLSSDYSISVEYNPYKVSIKYQGVEVGYAKDNGQSLGIMDIDVYTDDAHRHKGLALHTVTRLIDHCFDNHLTPQWGCWTANKASVGLANKLGFESIIEVKVIFVHFSLSK